MRVKFRKTVVIILLSCLGVLSVKAQSSLSVGQAEREYYVQTLTHIADPVLSALSKNELRKEMPVEAKIKGRESSTYLEAFGHLTKFEYQLKHLSILNLHFSM